MDIRLSHAEFMTEMLKRGIKITDMDENFVYVPVNFLEGCFEYRIGVEYDSENLRRMIDKPVRMCVNFRDSRTSLVSLRECLRANEKIRAIKAVRYHTNWGLKESKDFYDRIVDNYKNILERS